MDTALVVARSEADRSLLREALEVADAVGATLVVLYLLSADEFDDHVQLLDEIDAYETMQGGDPTEAELAVSRGEELVAEVTADADLDVEPAVVGAVSGEDPASTVLRTAEERSCDHLFISGRKRSPAGKALFGDVAQSVLMGFDGYVTVQMRA